MSFKFLTQKKRPIILENKQSPGDIIMLTAAVRDLYRSYSDYFDIGVDTSCKDIWSHNPYIKNVNPETAEKIKVEYPIIHKSNQKPYHFIHGFRKDLETKLGIDIPATLFKGDIHLSDKEKKWLPQVEEETQEPTKYWIIISGGKFDYTAKWWSPHRCQDVIDYFDDITWVQMGEKKHSHPPLKNVIDMRGKTNLRQAIRMVYHASGIVCPVTMFMHLAAAVPTKPEESKTRPCVVIAGGRENSSWEAYPGHQYLHTIGMLDCCESGGCWKSRIVPLNDNDEKNNSLCLKPIKAENDIIIPKCLDMITSGDVIRSVEKYLEFYK
jgi:ADP-heptose:LPS heptosyltransferase